MRTIFFSVSLLFIGHGFLFAKLSEDDDNLTHVFAVVAQKDANIKKGIEEVSTDSLEKQNLIKQEIELRKEGDAILNSCPTCPGLLTKGSDVALNRGDMKEAENLADRAVSAADSMETPNPAKLTGALDQRGLVSLKTGDYRKAMDDAQRVLSLAPADRQALSIYQDAKAQLAAQASAAKASLSAKKIAAAMAGPELSPGESHASVGADPRLKNTAQSVAAVGHLKDAQRLLERGDAEGALSAAAAAEAASPAFAADSRVMQAQAWFILKDLAKAVAQITEAIKLFAQQGRKSDLAAAYSQRAAFQNDLKNPVGAEADASSALDANPKLASAYFERARASDAMGKTDAALADIDRAAALDPGFMADRDEFHTRHRRKAHGGADEAGSAGAWTAPLRAVGILNLGVAAAGLLLLFSAGYFAWNSRSGSPVGRITWPRIARGAERDGARELDGQYRIVKKIGEGGMGTVYEGYDKNLKRPVAIKRLRPELQRNARERARFVREAELVAALQHPHTVQIYTIIQDDEDTHIVFEYIEGRTLHETLNASPGRHLPARRALELLRQMAEAVDHAHGRHVIHRDLKPANVMIDARGWAKVMDFGIARQVQDSLVRTTTNTVVGTPAYMPPEQAMGEVKKESDVYALGVTLYEMLTGGLPFKGFDDLRDKIDGRFLAPSLLLPGLPPAIDAVMAKAIAPRAEDRYHCCLDLYRAAESALGQATPG